MVTSSTFARTSARSSGFCEEALAPLTSSQAACMTAPATMNPPETTTNAALRHHVSCSLRMRVEVARGGVDGKQPSHYGGHAKLRSAREKAVEHAIEQPIDLIALVGRVDAELEAVTRRFAHRRR